MFFYFILAVSQKIFDFSHKEKMACRYYYDLHIFFLTKIHTFLFVAVSFFLGI